MVIESMSFRRRIDVHSTHRLEFERLNLFVFQPWIRSYARGLAECVAGKQIPEVIENSPVL